MSTPQLVTTASTFGIEHIDGLYRYALVLTRNQSEAEDLVQDTYVRAIEAFNRLREDSNVKAWLFTILRNLWLNSLRKRRIGPKPLEENADHHPADDLVGTMPDAYKLLEAQEDATRVRSAISQLPSDFQKILMLREFEELSYLEIARVLRCPAGTVMSRLGRARAKLRTQLTEGSFHSLTSGRLGPHEQLR